MNSTNPAAWSLRAGALIDATGTEPLLDAVLRVENGRIVAAGPASAFGTAADDPNVLDLRSNTVMPGLVDCHAHPTLPSDRRRLDAQLSEPAEVQVLTAAWQLGRSLRSGVTTLRDAGSRGDTMFHVRDAIRMGRIPGPRVLLAGRPITHSHGHLHLCGGVADSLDEIRRQVRVQVTQGADAIKLMASGGGEMGGIPYRASYTVDELRIAVQTAHALDRPTIAHCRATESIENALDAGVDTIAHVEFLSPGPMLDMGDAPASGLPRLDQRVAEKLAVSSAHLDLNPQSSGWDTVLRHRQKRDTEGLSERERLELENLETYFDHMLEVIRGLRALGLADRMGFGSDAGPFDTEFGHLEYNVHLARLGGLTPMESLQAVTRNAARVCGLGDRVGTLEVGRDADLLVLDANPLEDVQNLTRVAAVYQQGRRVVL